MSKTLLVVDDSATMRKVLEITFSGDEFRVVTADGSAAALGRLGEEPRAVLIDVALGADDGYALCREVRRRDPSVAIVLLSSRHNPYDAAAGRDAGADDFMDKPFDTQQMIDKVRRAVQARETGAAASAAAPLPGAASPAPPQSSIPRPGAAPSVAAQRPAAPSIASSPERARARTLMFGDRGAMSDLDVPRDAPREATPQPAVATSGTASQTKPSSAIYPPMRPHPAVSQKPLPVMAPSGRGILTPTAVGAHAPVPVAPAVQALPIVQGAPQAAVAASVAGATRVNGPLAGKLSELGLSAHQAEAVLALSREVVERVVWEVVPQLAEVLIKEEIARLTKEG